MRVEPQQLGVLLLDGYVTLGGSGEGKGNGRTGGRERRGKN